MYAKIVPIVLLEEKRTDAKAEPGTGLSKELNGAPNNAPFHGSRKT